jgi:hypothetical protein
VIKEAANSGLGTNYLLRFYVFNVLLNCQYTAIHLFRCRSVTSKKLTNYYYFYQKQGDGLSKENESSDIEIIICVKK